MYRAPRQILIAAALCAVAFFVLMVLAYWVEPARSLDFAALNGFVALESYDVRWVASRVAHMFDPDRYAVLVALLLVAALVLRRPRHAAAAVLLLVGANVSSQVLKPLLAHPRSFADWDALDPIAAAAFPSGHATASMSLVLAAILAAPRAYRPFVAVGGGLGALAVALALMVLNWHFPSDVVGGHLLATGWALVALAALRAAGERWPERGDLRRAAREAVPVRLIVLPIAAAALLAGAALVLVRAGDLVDYTQRHTASVAVGAGVVLAAAALLAAVTALTARRA